MEHSAKTVMEDPAEAVLMEHLSILMNDVPMLQVALKNVMAVLLGSDLSRRSADDDTEGKVTDIDPNDLMVCSKAVIKGFSVLTLPEASDWGTQHPQGHDQSFKDRIDEISRYKAATIYLQRLKSNNNNISKTVGRMFMLYTKCWFHVKAEAVNSLAGVIAPVLSNLFLNTIEESLTENGPNSDLIWTSNFSKALADRQLARRNQISQRISSLTLEAVEAVGADVTDDGDA